MNNILKSKLREYARSLRLSIDKGNTDNQLREQIAGMMAEVYRYIHECFMKFTLIRCIIHKWLMMEGLKTKM